MCNDEDGSYRADILRQLREVQGDLKRTIDRGQPPAEYARLAAASAAVEAAIHVVTNVKV